MVTLIRLPAPNAPHQQYDATHIDVIDGASTPLESSASCRGKLQCCICLEICSSIILRPECLHQFCRLCVKNIHIRPVRPSHDEESLVNECHACCQMELDGEMPSDVLLSKCTVPVRLLDKAKESNVIATRRETDCCQEHQFQGIKRATSTTHSSGKEKKQKQVNMEDKKVDDSEDGGSTSHFALSSVARGNDACPQTKGMVMRSSNISISLKMKKHENKESRDSSLEQDSELGVHGDDDDIHPSSSVGNRRGQKIKAFEERLAELAAFKAKHGHCNATNSSSSEYSSLRNWCGTMRVSHKKMQEGRTPIHPLSHDQIERLGALGFRLSSNSPFDKWFAKLVVFKAKHGHCNATKNPPSEYSSLGNWCNSMRVFHNKIQAGRTPIRPLSQDQIERLESLGFEWKSRIFITFEERLATLATFKAKHGHCNVTKNPSSEYRLFGHWCNNTRIAYRRIQEGKTPASRLSLDQIKRLEALGFEWTVKKTKTFMERLEELDAFKVKHGHCNVPTSSSSGYRSLGNWCNKMRVSHKKIQAGRTPIRPLSQDQIERLGALGFEWRVRICITFEERLATLATFKAKHGHCNVTKNPSSEYRLFGHWCNNTRIAYKRIQEGKTPASRLSLDQIQRLEALGFEWTVRRRVGVTFMERLEELDAFKVKHGHCNVPTSSSSGYRSLGQWCSNKRNAYKENRLSQDQIERLEALSFEWVWKTCCIQGKA